MYSNTKFNLNETISHFNQLIKLRNSKACSKHEASCKMQYNKLYFLRRSIKIDTELFDFHRRSLSRTYRNRSENDLLLFARSRREKEKINDRETYSVLRLYSVGVFSQPKERGEKSPFTRRGLRRQLVVDDRSIGEN